MKEIQRNLRIKIRVKAHTAAVGGSENNIWGLHGIIRADTDIKAKNTTLVKGHDKHSKQLAYDPEIHSALASVFPYSGTDTDT